MIELKKAEPQDCGAIHAMQVEAFAELLEKYGDTATNPGAEPLERIEARMAQDATDYYLILAEGRQIGAARVQRLPENVCRVSPIFILPAFQGRDTRRRPWRRWRRCILRRRHGGWIPSKKRQSCAICMRSWDTGGQARRKFYSPV